MSNYIFRDETKTVRQEFNIAVPANCPVFTVYESRPGGVEHSVAEFCDESHARLFSEADTLRDILSRAVPYLRKAQGDGAFDECAIDAWRIIRLAEESLARAGS